ncbi:HDIG domain-containing protein [Paludibacter sp. 221]|uniref:HD family phosphohydrolase n=1 Tax=Paludibacter sp. 221 TaxID=2302939 RepID=UPI0013D68C64|nr:HDIG domain-containing metalloprotein [Paludibacter sp. 221]NDV45842.1 HDIG domain-containing protein [Paludibacter sp. 221]
MKLKLTKSHIQNLFKFGLFLCVVIIIIQLFPSADSFNYKYEVGKPWRHELITASFDFPIYKSDEQIAEERAEIMRNFTPYYQIDTTVIKTQYEKFISDFQRNNGYQPILRNTIQQKFNKIYSRGIISAEEQQKLFSEEKPEINCIYPDRLTRTVKVTSLYTPTTAYNEILNGGTVADKNLLDTYNLSSYLIENVKYDTITSQMSEKELLKSLSLTMGMIQSGERIIDRGEIVTPETYIILNSLKMKYNEQESSFSQSYISLIGKIVIVLGFIVLLFTYFYLFRPRIYESYGNLLLILMLVLFIITLASLTIRFHNSVINYYMVPYALLPIIIRVFFDSRTALYTHIITSVIVSLMIDDPFLFLILQIAVGMLAVSTLKDLAQRSQLAQTALYIFLCYVVVYLSYTAITEGSISRIAWMPIIYFAISSMFLLFAYILIYLFEKIFGLISSVTLIELTNINSDLMLKFAETAPGTFQHSLQVSNIATEAAKKIGANSLLVRTGALYHDIGKMKNPGFFTENQIGGKNPLLERDYEDAARIIIDHVTDGIQIAKKHHLPEQIVNFIGTHHGRSKAKYFYNSFINDNPGVKPNEAAFTYPGPTPSSKETAILMMADAVEARSRSLKEYTEQSISDMVEDMIDSQIADGQFKDSPITFQDVEMVKQVFKEKLINIYHTRIAYPKAKEETPSEEPTIKEEEEEENTAK